MLYDRESIRTGVAVSLNGTRLMVFMGYLSGVGLTSFTVGASSADQALSSVRAVRRATLVVLVVLCVFGFASPVAASTKCDPRRTKCPGAAVKYKNCTEMRKVHPRGVARDAKAAGATGATVDAATYKVNAGSDRDKDGVACE